MKAHQNKQASQPLQSKSKAENQASVSSVLQAYKNNTAQLQAEEEEPLQGKFATAQLQAEEEEPLQGKFEAAQLQAEEEEPLQGKFETNQGAKSTPGKPEPVQQKANETGLPDNLKSGVENLSGHSMDDVKVHYNSSKPADLQAHAYAQGTDIHVASGQEKHLPHEAWHIAQQKQGRVQATTQMQGVAVNDDKSLETEADVMGGKAAQMNNSATHD